jgi:hypothetical protein
VKKLKECKGTRYVWYSGYPDVDASRKDRWTLQVVTMERRNDPQRVHDLNALPASSGSCSRSWN